MHFERYFFSFFIFHFKESSTQFIQAIDVECRFSRFSDLENANDRAKPQKQLLV